MVDVVRCALLVIDRRRAVELLAVDRVRMLRRGAVDGDGDDARRDERLAQRRAHDQPARRAAYARQRPAEECAGGRGALAVVGGNTWAADGAGVPRGQRVCRHLYSAISTSEHASETMPRQKNSTRMYGKISSQWRIGEARPPAAGRCRVP